jgi:hypothetical protein
MIVEYLSANYNQTNKSYRTNVAFQNKQHGRR